MARTWRYSAETMTDTDYIDDQELLANTPAKAEYLLHRHEQKAGVIDLPVNANIRDHVF